MSDQAVSKASTAFRSHFGEHSNGVLFAPGRVNLIGDHVDYNDGLVLPMPVPQGTAVAWAPSDSGRMEVFAAELAETDSFDPNAAEKPQTPEWRSYVRGMVASWPPPIPALRLAIAGDLPRGTGLSSSASLCVAVGRAIAATSGNSMDSVQLARLAQQTEHDFAGVACGIMDQMAVAAGEVGKAMLLDCRDLSFRQIAIPADWRIAVVQSGVTRGLVDGEYNLRRAQCEKACEVLGVTSLRDAAHDQLGVASLDETTLRRARHVVGEIERTRLAALALQSGSLEEFGVLLNQSHASLRDLFETSVPPVDALVDRLQRATGTSGGARMTGGGFGGAVVAVCSQERLGAVRQAAGSHAIDIL